MIIKSIIWFNNCSFLFHYFILCSKHWFTYLFFMPFIGASCTMCFTQKWLTLFFFFCRHLDKEDKQIIICSGLNIKKELKDLNKSRNLNYLHKQLLNSLLETNYLEWFRIKFKLMYQLRFSAVAIVKLISFQKMKPLSVLDITKHELFTLRLWIRWIVLFQFMFL